MKRFMFLTLIAVFLLNVLAVTAWATPCLSAHDQGHSQQDMAQGMDHTMHDQGPEKSTQKHCKGICLCQFASLQQPLFMAANNHFLTPPIAEPALITRTALLTSRAVLPPLRPPKSFS